MSKCEQWGKEMWPWQHGYERDKRGWSPGSEEDRGYERDCMIRRGNSWPRKMEFRRGDETGRTWNAEGM